MKLSPEEFKSWPQKSITLFGMAGVGKTRLAALLRRHQWFHYSADYRIGTRYLGEPILDHIKQQAMQVPFLRELLRSDSIYIANNISVDALGPVVSFLGMLGNPERGGLTLKEFKRRQALYRDAQAAAMKDVPEFILKAREIYGYRHFINDSSGSLCELDDPQVLRVLAEHTLVLYIQATGKEKQALIDRAAADPPPLLYRESFLEEEVGRYLKERGLAYVALVDPADFARWVFPKLYEARIPRYENFARDHGYTVSTDELAGVADESGFLALVESVLRRSAG